MLEGRFISPHDMEIASRIADTLCGGLIERGSTVDEQWLLDLERKHFVALAQMPKTQERIASHHDNRQTAAQLSAGRTHPDSTRMCVDPGSSFEWNRRHTKRHWIPASAGMTTKERIP